MATNGDFHMATDDEVPVKIALDGRRQDGLMEASPGLSSEPTPSPRLVAAWLLVGHLPTEQVPLWAAHWLADGLDGEALRALAGLHGDDPHDVRDLLPAALAEVGVVLPETGNATATVAFREASIEVLYRWVAETFLAGRAGPRWVVDKVYEVVANNNYDDASMAGPMGALWLIDDEWDMGWGRGSKALVRDITAACEAQANR